ncbi:MAG TPA: hypothetical protein VE130_12005 [Nitrososphaeraceae archaeon]|nr:hypothetical protein [Nitrososphaeraceae archaeon]
MTDINVSTPYSTGTPKVHHGSRDRIENDYVTLTEKVDLTKKQYEVLKIVCDTYQKSVPEYMQEALVEVMRSDIEEGNFCDALLDKLGGEDREEEKGMKNNPPTFMNDNIDSLQF